VYVNCGVGAKKLNCVVVMLCWVVSVNSTEKATRGQLSDLLLLRSFRVNEDLLGTLLGNPNDLTYVECCVLVTLSESYRRVR
jgi:hypothetical protein